MSRTARVLLAGLLLSAGFVGFLGWYIPNRVANDFLAAQSAADQAALDFLVSSDIIGSGPDLDLGELDGFVRQSILRGDFVRAKLWSIDGTILYSDESDLIGQHFTPDEDFEAMRGPISEVSDLSEPENYLEAGEFGGLLETYVPVLDGDRVLAVWEIYRTLDAYNESVDQTQRLVWLGVGSGLGLLGLFLVSSLGLLVRTADEQRTAAESRAEDLVTLLDVARTAAQADGPEILVDRLRPLLESAPQLGYLSAVLDSHDAGRRILLDLGSSTDRPDAVVASASSSAGHLTVRVEPGRLGSTQPTLDALAEEVLVGLMKAILAEGLAEYRSQLEDVMEQLVDTEESERRRLAGDIHDSVARDLYRILYGVRTLAARAPAEDAAELAELEATVVDTTRTLRELLRDLYPTVAEDVGLAAALASLVDRVDDEYGLDVDLDVDEALDPGRDVKLALYRVSQEALVNAARHSGSDNASVAVWREADRIRFRISDGGDGPPASWRPGMGIWLMRDRVERLGGHLEVDGEHGMIVSGAIPIGGGR